MSFRFVCALSLAVGMAACDVIGIGDERSLALLGDAGIPVEIMVPDTVVRNARFGVSIAYWGSSTCTRLDEVEVSSHGAAVTLMPFVKHPRFESCTDDLHRFTVEPEVSISVSSRAEVRVMGLFDRRDTTVIRYTHVR